MAGTYGPDAVFNAFGCGASDFADWNSKMDSYIATWKANGGTDMNVFIYTDGYGDFYGTYIGNGAGDTGWMNAGFSGGRWGYTFAQLATIFVSKCHSQGLTVSLQCGCWTPVTRNLAFTTYSSVYINGLAQICRDLGLSTGDRIDMVFEPNNEKADGITQDAYISWLETATATVKAVHSGIRCGIFGWCPWDCASFISATMTGSGWISRFPQDSIFVTHNGYYIWNNTVNSGDPPFYTSYWNRNYATAKAQLISYLEGSNFGVMTALSNGIKVVIENIGTNTGVRSGYTATPENEDKLQYLIDITQWCQQRSVWWTTDFGFSPDGIDYWAFWQTPDDAVFASLTTLSVFGQALVVPFSGNITLPYHDSLTTLANLQAVNGVWGVT